MDFILSTKDLCFGNIIEYPKIDIEQKCTTFICGESGCGKSTLLKLFNATLSPSNGTVFYKGNDISDMDTITLRKEVLLVSQAVFLFDGTIAENFLEYYKYRDVSPLPENDFRKYLDICCADFPSDSRCETMSGGERQRIFTAICLSFKPKVLMLDEPTSALDQATARTFFQNVKEFCKSNGITIITISHDENLVDTFADKKIYLEKRLNS